MKYYITNFKNTKTGFTVMSEIFFHEHIAKDWVAQVEKESKGFLEGFITTSR